MKNYSIDKVTGLFVRLKISTPADPVKGTDGYCAGSFYVACRAVGECVNRGVETKTVSPDTPDIFLGTAKDEPWTIEEVSTALKNFDGLNEMLHSEIKKVYLEAIDVDIDE